MRQLKDYFRFYWNTIKPYIGIQILIFFIGIIQVSLKLLSPYLSKIFIDDVLNKKNISYLYIFIVLKLGMFVITLCISSFQTIICTKLNNNLLLDLQCNLYNKIQEKDILFFYENKPGDILNKIMNETRQVLNLFTSNLMSIIAQLYSFIAILLIMISFDIKMTLLSLSTIPLLLLLFSFFNKKFREYTRWVLTSQGKMINILQENVRSIYTIKIYNIYKYAYNRFKKSTNEYIKDSYKLTYTELISNNILSVIKMIPYMIFLYYGSTLVINQKASAGDIIAFASYMNMIYEPIGALSKLNVEIQKNFVGFKRYFEIYTKDEMIIEPNESHKAKRKSIIKSINSIHVKNISFSFDGQNNILDNIYIEANKGELIIISGNNGKGKTTLLNLLSGLYKPNAGEILINDIPIEEIDEKSFINNLGVLTQDTFLFRDSIENNIYLGREFKKELNINKLTHVLPIYNFITKSLLGFSSMVNDNGTNFSGGQKQKLGIMRAFINSPSYILLDEPTAALDEESREYFIKYLKEIKANKIIFMITHDPSLLDIATQVIYL